MDPVSALGLVASIVQLVTFSHELLSSARDISSSVGGTSKEVIRLRLLVESVQQSSRGFAKLIASDGNENQLLLRDIAAECDTVAETLMERLSKLQTKNRGLRRRIEALVIAGKYTSSKDEIYSLKARLSELEARLSQWWQLETQSRNHSSLARKVDDLTKGMARLEAGSAPDQLRSLQLDVSRSLAVVTESSDQSGGQDEEDVPGKTSVRNVERRQSLTEAHIRALRDTQAAFERMSAELRTMDRHEAITRSLSFPDIMMRRDNIPAAYRETVKWIFDSRRTRFGNWLREGRGIFWVNGLAGSGKSTLMKFVSSEGQTKESLELWASSSKLVTASYFFWNAGSEMQKSQQGLLQSLLLQVFRSSPSLVQSLCSERSAADSWDMRELKATFRRLASQTGLGLKFCFFIDGLDEFGGAVEDLIELVNELSASEHIKMCVSSRPWPAFLAEWNASEQSLKVQDFTRDDMEKYIREMLAENEQFRDLSRHDPRYEGLVHEISARAEGVWLWVYLVVRDLLRDMRDKEPYEQLVIRLRSYPQELEMYYEEMLNRIDKIHQAESAQLFLLALDVAEAYEVPLTVLPYLKSWDRFEPVSVASSSPVTDEEVNLLREEWVSRLQNRCRDLLKISSITRLGVRPVHRFTVEFLHRTVRDFLNDTYHARLLQRIPETFEPLVFMGSALVRLMNREGDHEWSMYEDMQPVLWAAWHFESRTNQEKQISLLAELDLVMKSRLGITGDWGSWCARQRKPDSEWYAGVRSLLDIVVVLGGLTFVRYKLETDPGCLNKPGRPLLAHALHCHFRCPESLGGYPARWYIDEEMVRLLLEFHADPNQTFQTAYGELQTPFLSFVTGFATYCALGQVKRREEFFNMLVLLLQHGANPWVKIPPLQLAGSATSADKDAERASSDLKGERASADREAVAEADQVEVEECSVAEYLGPYIGPVKKAELERIVAPMLAARRATNEGMMSKIWRWMGY